MSTASGASTESHSDPFAFLDEDPVNVGELVPRFKAIWTSPDKHHPDYGRPHSCIYTHASLATGQLVYMGVDFTDPFEWTTFPLPWTAQRTLGLQEFLGSICKHLSAEALLHIHELYRIVSDATRSLDQRRRELLNVARPAGDDLVAREDTTPELRAKSLKIDHLSSSTPTNERDFLIFLWDAPVKYLAPRVYTADDTLSRFQGLGLDPHAVLIRARDAHRM